MDIFQKDMENFIYNLLDFEIFKNFNLLHKKRLFIWGAALKGRQIQRTLLHMGIQIVAFCDSNVNKWGKRYEGVPIISPYKLKEFYQNDSRTCIISCVFSENEVLKTLQELGMNHISFLSYWGIKTACVLYGIALEPEENLPTYDEVWKYQKRCFLRGNGILISFLRKTATNNSNQIWNWQPGKVASTTVETRIKQAGVPVIHLHDLAYPSHLWTNELESIFNLRIQNSLLQGIKIVTGVREPLSRDYSAFWQPFTDERTYLMSILNSDFQAMYENYIELLLKGYEYTKMLLKEASEWVWNDEFVWFNEQIKKHVGVDIYQYPFDREKGYQIIHQGNVQIFIYKAEKLDSIMPVLSSFLGKDVPSIENMNQTQNKTYHLASKEFRKNIKLPRSYVEHYYKNNVYMNHFYTDEEQEMYLAKWENCIKD